MTETILSVVENKRFEREKVILDGHLFSKCVFVKCTLVYSGGEYNTHECAMSPGCQFEFLDAANRTLNTIRMLCDTIPSLRSELFPNWRSWNLDQGRETIQ